MENLKICVIGAGASGLPAAKHAIDMGMQVTIYEQTQYVGGTWVYTDRVGKDQYGLNIHTSMYKSLRTNLPKEMMGYPDFPFPEQDASYITFNDVLSYLQLYTRLNKLDDKIKFQHHVVSVRPCDDTKWEVIVRDLPNDNTETHIFDGILVCNGHFHTPSIPKYTGKELFQGKQIHSHDFRIPDSFKDTRILIIGSGPSGRDLSCELSKVAKTIMLSHHEKNITTNLPNVLVLKPDVESFYENGVRFVDGTTEPFDVIVYCTGYKFTFPFLTPECGITVDDNYVQPLFKHIVNINHPTMALIGIPFGEKKLPTKEEMLADTATDMESRWSRGMKKRHAHQLGIKQRDYFDDLAAIADIKPVEVVMTDLWLESKNRRTDDFLKFRNDRFRIVDNKTFVKLN